MMADSLDFNFSSLDSFVDVEVDHNVAKWKILINQIFEGKEISVIGSYILKVTESLGGHFGAELSLSLSEDDGTRVSSDYIGGVKVWRILSLFAPA